MSIFSRFKDIVSSNINSMLDKAENPEKLLRLMIQEMEDTLVELKSSCAQVMAERAKISRAAERVGREIAKWAERAELAVSKGREDLAREALVTKRELTSESEHLAKEAEGAAEAVARYQDEICQVEDKLQQAREKQRGLIRRHNLARERKISQTQIRRYEHSDVMQRFENFERKIDRMESETDLVNIKPKDTLEDEFARLNQDEGLEKELSELKARINGETTSESAN